jgi:hypothetical protein
LSQLFAAPKEAGAAKEPSPSCLAQNMGINEPEIRNKIYRNFEVQSSFLQIKTLVSLL